LLVLSTSPPLIIIGAPSLARVFDMIRPITPADFRELLEIEAQAAPKSEYDFWEFSNLYARYRKTFLVAESDQIDGYIVFSPKGHIISMVVRPLSRRRGIGTQLISEALNTCVGKRLHLEVRVSNVVAQKFYRDLGFRTRERRKRYYHDGEDAIVMQLPAGKGE
jgi:ribosomal-protein-alanine N-acetyltransferase